jgi:hypothetical protein
MSMLHVHVHAAQCVCVRVRVYKCWNAELSGIPSVQYRIEKINNAGTGPVPDQAEAVQHFFWSGTGLELLMPECRC